MEVIDEAVDGANLLVTISYDEFDPSDYNEPFKRTEYAINQ